MGKKKQNSIFINEEDFTLNGIIPWLIGSKSFKNIKYTHGRDEFGRDVIFSRNEAGNRQSWMGVIVKYGDITENQRSHVDEIIRQTKLAIKTPYILPGCRSSKTISGIYVVASGKITSNAEVSIKNSSDLEGRSIEFYSGEEILNDIKISPAKVSRVKLLIRIKNKTLKELKKFIKLNFKDVDYSIYIHNPEEEMFESRSYTDVNFNLDFDEFISKTSKLNKHLLKLSGLDFVQLIFYYPKVYSKQQLTKAKNRFLKKVNLKVDEREDCPCFVYDCLITGKNNWGGIKNVDNMQIL